MRPLLRPMRCQCSCCSCLLGRVRWSNGATAATHACISDRPCAPADCEPEADVLDRHAKSRSETSELTSAQHTSCSLLGRWRPNGSGMVRKWFANGSQMVREWFSDGSRMVREWFGVREDGIGQSHFERFRFDLMETVFDLSNVGMRISMISIGRVLKHTSWDHSTASRSYEVFHPPLGGPTCACEKTLRCACAR